MMRVTVKLFATLRRGRFDRAVFELPKGTTVGQVVERLAVPPGQVTLLFVNGRHARRETVLADGDELALFPPVGGG